MTDTKRIIAIVNSSSFGISYPEHLRTLEQFAQLIRVDIPNDAPASVFHEKLRDADGIIASVTPVYTRDVLLGLPKLQLLARHGVGCDNVDLDTCAELGIAVSKVGPEVERESVAQMAIGLMNATARRIGEGCDISSGVHIYTHSSVKRCVSGRRYESVERKPVTIGNRVFVGANAVINMGVTIGDEAVMRLPLRARQHCGDPAQHVSAAREQGDAGAELRQFRRGGAADAFGGAADQRVFAGKI